MTVGVAYRWRLGGLFDHFCWISKCLEQALQEKTNNERFDASPRNPRSTSDVQGTAQGVKSQLLQITDGRWWGLAVLIGTAEQATEQGICFGRNILPGGFDTIIENHLKV